MKREEYKSKLENLRNEIIKNIKKKIIWEMKTELEIQKQTYKYTVREIKAEKKESFKNQKKMQIRNWKTVWEKGKDLTHDYNRSSQRRKSNQEKRILRTIIQKNFPESLK